MNNLSGNSTNELQRKCLPLCRKINLSISLRMFAGCVPTLTEPRARASTAPCATVIVKQQNGVGQKDESFKTARKTKRRRRCQKGQNNYLCLCIHERHFKSLSYIFKLSVRACVQVPGEFYGSCVRSCLRLMNEASQQTGCSHLRQCSNTKLLAGTAAREYTRTNKHVSTFASESPEYPAEA